MWCVLVVAVYVSRTPIRAYFPTARWNVGVALCSIQWIERNQCGEEGYPLLDSPRALSFGPTRARAAAQHSPPQLEMEQKNHLNRYVCTYIDEPMFNTHSYIYSSLHFTNDTNTACHSQTTKHTRIFHTYNR